MENTMTLYKKILKDRVRFYKEKWMEEARPQDWHTYQTYQNALDMFEHAEAGDYACLSQFDYMGEEED